MTEESSQGQRWGQESSKVLVLAEAHSCVGISQINSDTSQGGREGAGAASERKGLLC